MKNSCRRAAFSKNHSEKRIYKLSIDSTMSRIAERSLCEATKSMRFSTGIAMLKVKYMKLLQMSIKSV
jgi:hypothetical protein